MIIMPSFDLVLIWDQALAWEPTLKRGNAVYVDNFLSYIKYSLVCKPISVNIQNISLNIVIG